MIASFDLAALSLCYRCLYTMVAVVREREHGVVRYLFGHSYYSPVSALVYIVSVSRLVTINLQIGARLVLQ